jgi:hypothetical protein
MVLNKGLEEFLLNAHCSSGDRLEYKADFNKDDKEKYGSLYKGFCLVEDIGCIYCKNPDFNHYFCINPIREVKYENNNSVSFDSTDSRVGKSKRNR